MNREVCGICWCSYDKKEGCGCTPLDAAMQQPRAMAQAYENGYKAGAAAEREACAQIADAEASIEGIAQRIAAAIRARSKE